MGYADGGSTTYGYVDTSNEVTKSVTVSSSVASCTHAAINSEIYYDGLGRKNLETTVGVATVRTTYDGLGRVYQVTDPYLGSPGNTTTTTFDALNRVIQTQTSADGATANTGYAGAWITVRDQAGKWRKSQLDGLGRLVAVIEDPSASLTPPGGTTISNAAVAPATALKNYSTAYTYDALDNLLTVSQGQQSRSFAYDSLKRLICASNPESRVGTASCTGDPLPTTGVDRYSYDANGNLTGKTDPRAVATNLVYDQLNRLTQKSYSGGTAYATPTVSYLWDTVFIGALTSVSNTMSITSYDAYDAMGRPLQTSQTPQTPTQQPAYVFHYAYNTAGAREQVQYPSQRTITTCYDAGGRPAGVSGQMTGGTTNYAGRPLGQDITYAPHGGLLQVKLSNGTYETWTYNQRMQPLTIQLGHSAGAGDIRALGFDYGTSANNGDLLTQTIGGSGLGGALTQTYRYDALSRLARATETAGGTTQWNLPFDYDAYGNGWVTTGWSGISPSNFTPQSAGAYDAATNHTTVNGATVDSSGGGDQTSIGGYSYAYDAEHRMVKSSLNIATVYQYDGDGRRVAKVECPTGQSTCDTGTTGATVTRYAYDATGNLAAEYSNSMSVASGTWYVMGDHLGSTRMATDSSGNPVQCHDYRPFGEEIFAGTGGRSGCYGSGPASGILFTGKMRDSSWEAGADTAGLDYFGARYFSGAQGRFTTPDPVGVLQQKILDPQQWNMYAYARNNPLAYGDFEGKFIYWIHERITSGVLSGLGYSRGVIASVNQANKATDDPQFNNEIHAFMHSQGRRVTVNGQLHQETASEARAEEMKFIDTSLSGGATALLSGDFATARTALGESLHAAQDEKHEWTAFDLHSGSVADLGNATGRFQVRTDLDPTQQQLDRATQRTREVTLQFENQVRTIGQMKKLTDAEIEERLYEFRNNLSPHQ